MGKKTASLKVGGGEKTAFLARILTSVKRWTQRKEDGVKDAKRIRLNPIERIYKIFQVAPGRGPTVTIIG